MILNEEIFLGCELVIFIILVLVNLRQKLIYEKKHGAIKSTDQFKISFYQWNLKSGIARAVSLFVLIMQNEAAAESADIAFRRLMYTLPCFVWNEAYTQVVLFFCTLYFKGYGGDWMKCFHISFNFSTKILYGLFAVLAVYALVIQDYAAFFSNSLIIIALLLTITVSALLFFSINVCKMITGLSDYSNMAELVKVKNKTQIFSGVIACCYFVRIALFYLFAFEIRSDPTVSDSWIIATDIFICEVVSYWFSLNHHIDIGQDQRDQHSLEMQNYIPTPFLESNNYNSVQ